MTIDLTNYEEYFLLYADNELPARDRAFVEAFVEDHPELKEEFEAILQTVLPTDDDTKLNNKSFLYRNDSFINAANYEEILVQYFDNELNQDEVAATEHFLAQHPQFNKEADLIKRTKLLPDTLIVFPDKELLYKKTERVKVVPLIWLRLAAAAVFLGFGFWFGSSYLSKPAVVDPSSLANSAKKQSTVSPAQKPVIVAVPDTLTQPNKVQKLAVTTPADRKEKKETLPIKKVLKAVLQLPSTKDVAVTNTKVTAIKNMSTTSAKPVDENLVTVDKDVRSTIIEQLNKGNDVATTDKDYHDEIINTKPLPDNYARTTAYIEEQNPDYIFNMPEEKFNKTKVGSFLKKVKRNIERRLPFNGMKD